MDVSSRIQLCCFLFLMASQVRAADNKDLKRGMSMLQLRREPKPTLPHPALYYSASEVKQLRIKAVTTHEKIAATIKAAGVELVKRPELYMPPLDYDTFAASWNEHYGNRLCAFSFYCVLYPKDTTALDLVKVYMDRLASYPDWYVAASHGRDQVPVGHSLTGFATAFDILYGAFNATQKRVYYARIKNITLHMYETMIKSRGSWSTQYIHNHAPSNIVAILLGALVVSRHEPEVAKPWIEAARQRLDRALQILSLVTDGSMDEGISYGSYTTRGLTQYVFLMKRHYDVDLTNNQWLRRYFWSLYKTMLPGFQRSVGIADSSHNWFYGPESQLVFLDAYVMRSGYGNWLAGKIRQGRKTPPKGVASKWSSQVWCTVHTEFIFYDATLKPRKPLEDDAGKMYLFPDWGVVTYGGGQETSVGNTFLSFKSGAVNGEAVHEIMSRKLFPDFVDGWKNFNAGHEHPDQNSFVFAPNGNYFVTEALYGPKFSFLDNVLLFSPSETSNCNQPWEGQLGECNKWLLYKEYSKNTSGEILTASTLGDSAFIAGESATVYSKSLGLESVYRGLLLLNPEVLVVVDTIRLRPGSRTKMAAAMFHNMLHTFKEHTILGHDGALVEHADGDYVVFSMTQGSDPIVSLNNGVQPLGLREGSTNYVNVTFELGKEVTNIVHVFHGPRYKVKSASILPSSGKYGVKMALNINGVDYRISVATLVKSAKRLTDPWAERRKVTGFGGYARVDAGEMQYLYGLKKSDQSYARYFGDVAAKEVRTRKTTSAIWIETDGIKMTELMFLLSLATVAALGSCVLYKARSLVSYVRNANRFVVAAVGLTILLVCSNSICIDPEGRDTCWIGRKSKDLGSESPPNFEKPFVFITSLPGTGSELLGHLFNESNEFLHVAVNEQNMTIPATGVNTKAPHICWWDVLENEHNSLTLGWLNSLKSRTYLHFNNGPDTEATRSIKRHIREHRNAPVALGDSTGFWNTKIRWLRDVIGEKSFQPVLVVRDPRSWIFAILEEYRKSRNADVFHSLTKAYDKMLKECDSVRYLSNIPRMKHTLEEALSKPVVRIVEKLAVVWTVSTAVALRQGYDRGAGNAIHVVRFEDIMRRPQKTAQDLFGNLGVPLSSKRISKLDRTVKSGFYSLPYIGRLQAAALESWRSGLSSTEVQQIDNICHPLMRILGYSYKSKPP